MFSAKRSFWFGTSFFYRFKTAEPFLIDKIKMMRYL